MAIPIIGQPVIEDWFIALQVKCPCGIQFMLVGQPGSMRACKGEDGRGAGCRRVYQISTLPIVQQNGEIGSTPILTNADGSFNAGLQVGVPR